MGAGSTLVQYARGALALVDSGGTLLQWNAAFADFAPKAAVGRCLTEFFCTPIGEQFDSWEQLRVALLGGLRQAPAIMRGTAYLVPTKPQDDWDVLVIENRGRHAHATRELMLEAGSDVQIITDIDGRIVDHSLHASRLTPDEARAIVGKRIDRAFRSAHNDLGYILRTTSAKSLEVELVTVDGPRHVLLHRTSHPTGLVLFRFIELGRRTEDPERVELLQHAQSVVRAARGLAHELNNSCTALLGYLSLAEQRDQRRVEGDQLAAMHGVVRRLRRMSRQLQRFGTDLADPATGEDDLVTGGGEIEELVQDSVALALNGTALSTSFALGGPLPEVRIPRSFLAQALFNVITNAADASQDNGRIHIEAREHRDHGELILLIRDEGDGMDRDTLHHALEPYFSTKPGAAGMGLTVAAAQLQRFGARLEIETDPGYGTTVRMRLPLADAPVPDPIDRDLQGPAFQDLRVLLVGDDPLVRRSVATSLQAVGCHVVDLDNGDRALEIVRDCYRHNRPFDLIVTDLMVPGRFDGVQLLRRLREFDRDLPGLLISGLLDDEDAIPYRVRGFQGILHKPFGVAEILDAVAHALSVPDR